MRRRTPVIQSQPQLTFTSHARETSWSPAPRNASSKLALASLRRHQARRAERGRSHAHRAPRPSRPPVLHLQATDVVTSVCSSYSNGNAPQLVHSCPSTVHVASARLIAVRPQSSGRGGWLTANLSPSSSARRWADLPSPHSVAPSGCHRGGARTAPHSGLGTACSVWRFDPYFGTLPRDPLAMVPG